MMAIAELHASLASVGIPVVGVAHYPDPASRAHHVSAAPAWWHVAESYAVRVDVGRALSAEDEALAADVIAEWATLQ